MDQPASLKKRLSYSQARMTRKEIMSEDQAGRGRQVIEQNNGNPTVGYEEEQNLKAKKK